MTFHELDTVVLERDLPEHDLRRGDLGAIVHRHARGRAQEGSGVSGDVIVTC